MTRYTVAYVQDALEALARIWLASNDRTSITQASDEVDRVLRDDAHLQGCAVGTKLRQLMVAPLVVEFTVEEDDRKVTIWSVRHIGALTNGQ